VGSETRKRRGSLRRLGAGLVASAAVAALLTGCAAGQVAQTVDQYPVVDGAAGNAGQLLIRNAGIAPPSGINGYAKGGTATLQLVVVNGTSKDDRLVSASSPVAGGVVLSAAGLPEGISAATSRESASVSLSPSSTVTGTPAAKGSASGARTSASRSAPAASGAGTGTPIEVRADQVVQVGFSVVGPNIVLTGLNSALLPSQTVPMTFRFASGASLSLALPVKLSSASPSRPVVSAATAPNE
jgi:copper(I)-binding protein